MDISKAIKGNYISISKDNVLEELFEVIKLYRNAIFFTNDEVIQTLKDYLKHVEKRKASTVKVYSFVIKTSDDLLETTMKVLCLGEIDFDYKYRILEWDNEQSAYSTPELPYKVFFINFN